MTPLKLLDTPDKWTKGDFAINIYGDSAEIHAPEAVAWCVLGAMEKCYSHDRAKFEDFEMILILVIEKKYGMTSIVQWQDEPTTTFKMVHELLELAQKEFDSAHTK